MFMLCLTLRMVLAHWYQFGTSEKFSIYVKILEYNLKTLFCNKIYGNYKRSMTELMDSKEMYIKIIMQEEKIY